MVKKLASLFTKMKSFSNDPVDPEEFAHSVIDDDGVGFYDY